MRVNLTRKGVKNVRYLLYLWSLFMAAVSWAAANTNVVNIATDAKDTFDAVTPIALYIVAGVVLITLGVRIFKRMSRAG